MSAEDHRSRMPVVPITGIDAVLRDALVADMMLDLPRAVEVRYDVDTDLGALRRLVVGPAGIREDVEVDMDHPCVSCAMREDAIPVLDRLAEDPRVEAVLLAPPISADPSIVAGTLRGHERLWSLRTPVAVLSARSARHDLLGDDTLAERGLRWAADDHRSVGEALAAQIEYSELIVIDGEDGGDRGGIDRDCAAGLELIEHLRAPDQLLALSLHDLDVDVVLGGRLDHEAGLRRRDPREVRPYGGPTAHGTWTLELSSARPFHPRRFLDRIEDLGSGRMRGRGCFWVPDRPDSVCQWDGAGGQVSVGVVAAAGHDLPSTHLVITGVDAADAPRVRRAFAHCLLTQEEWRAGLSSWLGVPDVLAPWLGEREPAQRRSA